MQVIFATSESEASLTEMLGGLDFKLIAHSDGDDNVCTRTTYAHESSSALENAHLVALPGEVKTFAHRCNEVPATVASADVVTGSKTTYGATGLPATTQQIDPVDGLNWVDELTRYEYDTLGRVTKVTDPTGQATTTVYTPTGVGLLTEMKVTNPLGHSTTTVFDPLLAVPTSATDANGRATTATYDALGRLLTVRYPQHPKTVTDFPSVEYEYTVQSNGLNAVVTKTLSADGKKQHTSSVLYDALLRPFQTQQDARGGSGGRAVTHTIYDATGRIVEQTEPWQVKGGASATPVAKDPDTSGTTTFTYDHAGRETAKTFWIGTTSNDGNKKWSTQTAYDGATTLVVPPIGGVPTATTVDGRGRTIGLTQYHRDPDARADADEVGEVLKLTGTTTTYTYNQAGLLAGMTDTGAKVEATNAEKNSWSYTYDKQGRQTQAVDPDAGTTTTTYDVLGRVTKRKNGNGQLVGYTYDALGRTTSIRDLPDEATAVTDGQLRASWTYDTTLKGVLASSTRVIDQKPYTTRVDNWDAAYRPTQTSVVLPDIPQFVDLGSKTFSTKYTYTVDGQTAKITYPAVTKTGVTTAVLPAETVTTVYDKNTSQPSWMGGGFGWGVYVASSGYSYDGRPVFTDLGNTYGGVVSYLYENGTKRLQNVRLDRERIDGTELDVTYGYDQAGNVTSIKDAPTNTGLATDASRDNQCFNYDELARLQTAWTARDANCGQAPSTGAMGGAAPYWNNYTYDLLGNRTSLTTHTTAGSATVTTNTYGTGQAGPHQLVTSTTGTTTNTYAYDDAGNRVTKTPTGGAATTYGWDVEGELTTTGATTNSYDADGNRLLRTDTTGTTVYLGGQEVLITPAGDVKATRYYQFDGKTIAVRTGRGLNAVTSLVTDHHGTPLAAVPNGGNPTITAVRRLYTDPFGGTRGSSSASTVPGDIQFLGKNRDTGSGLTLLGARYYDEAIGEFISVDPLLDLTDPQQWNAYAYANNTPTTRFDPTGLRPDDFTGAQWNEYKRTGDVPTTVSSGGSGTVDPPVRSGEGSNTPASDSWLYSNNQDRVLRQWPNHYSDKLGICGQWDPGSVCKEGLNTSDVFKRVRANFGELFPPGLMAEFPSDTQLDHVGQVIPTNLKVFGVETGQSGSVVVTDIYDDGFDVAAVDGAIDGTVQFRILQEGPNMYLTVDGHYDKAPTDVWPWLYNAGSPMLWTYFSANIASKTGVIG